MRKTHFVMWLWQGWRPVYDRRDAIAMARQLIRYGDLPSHSRICLLTDQPRDWFSDTLSKLGVMELPLWPELPGLRPASFRPYPHWWEQRGEPNCFRRLKILDPETQARLGIEPGDVVISVDMDALVLRSLRFLRRLSGATFCAMNGKGSRIHGSLWGFEAGKHVDVWTDFDPLTSPAEVKKRQRNGTKNVGSDQAWLSLRLPDVPLWTEADGIFSWPRTYTRLAGPSPELAFISFAGPHKPRGETVKHVTPWLWDHAMMAFDG